MGRSKPVGRAKKAVFALLAAVTLLLSGCEGSPVGSMVEEMTGGVEGLLSPPRFSEEQDAVYAVLSAHLSGSMRLCYPQEGENLSAFTLCELDGSPGGEAVVFYEPTSASAASPVQMAVLDEGEDGWTVTDSLTLEGSGIIDLTLLSLPEGPAFAVGLQYAGENGSSLLRIFAVRDGKAVSLSSIAYQEKVFGDFSGDGRSSLAVLYTAEDWEGGPSVRAGLYQWQEGAFALTSSCAVNPGISRYEKLSAAEEGDGIRFYLDGYLGSRMVTEVLALEDGSLRNLTLPLGDYPGRPGLLSMDADGDGLTEIPAQEPLPGYEETEEPLCLTRWYRLEEGGYRLAYTGYVSSLLSYQFIFPGDWEGKVTVQRDDTAGEAAFVRVEDGATLFLLKAAPVSGWQAGDYPGYQLVAERGQTVFLTRVVTGTGGCALTAEEIVSRFCDLGE